VDIVREVTGFEGEVVYDRSKPDGTPRKLLDVTRIHATGWHHGTALHEGIERTYRWFVEHAAQVRR
jgi:GDP-L-fucose synthase